MILAAVVLQVLTLVLVAMVLRLVLVDVDLRKRQAEAVSSTVEAIRHRGLVAPHGADKPGRAILRQRLAAKQQGGG